MRSRNILLTIHLMVGLSSTLVVSAQQSGSALPAPVAAVRSLSPQSSAQLPRVYAPTRSTALGSSPYPWKIGITATVFWIGEAAAPPRNPVPNDKSSWDVNWVNNYGGYDDPNPESRNWDFAPKAFIPRQNPFYIALPYNDIIAGGQTKSEAARVIPWFRKEFKAPGKTVIKGRWIAMRYGNKICYGQWEDVGPWTTDDAAYVFGNSRPRNSENNAAGIDVSPAIRDFLGIRSGAKLDWRFVEVNEVADGPWKKYGDNNPFVKMKQQAAESQQLDIVRLREMRDQWFKENGGTLRAN